MEIIARIKQDQIAEVTTGLKGALRTLQEIMGEPKRKELNGHFELPDVKAIEVQDESNLLFAEQLFLERRNREKFLATDHFGEPQWDVMLDLFIAERRGKQISVSSACIAASVPPTTALRHIVLLTDQGHIERVPDPEDCRRVFLKLSRDMSAKMERYLTATMHGRTFTYPK
jgi:DNA-binding MarR family transcriptional regulator